MRKASRDSEAEVFEGRRRLLGGALGICITGPRLFFRQLAADMSGSLTKAQRDERKGAIQITGAMYDLANGMVNFIS